LSKEVINVRHIIAAILAVIVMACGWHNALAFLPLLPYAVAGMKIIPEDTIRALKEAAYTEND
jgi:hypothetical protein